MFQDFKQFEARSGRVVKVGEDGTLVFDHVNGYLTPESAMDAEEFFQAKRDRDRGVWRWPENPHIVVYPRPNGGTALNELTAESASWEREWAQLNMRENLGAEAVAAYFDAHPDPKPWEDAKDGDIWALSFESGATSAWVRGDGFWHLPDNPEAKLHLGHSITDGRRIWPEDAS